MTILFENVCEAAFDFSMEKQVEKLVEYVCHYVKCPYETEVSVTVVSKGEIQQINREHREVDSPTDVLSFPMMNYNFPCDFQGEAFSNSLSVSMESDELVLGDIVLCSDVIKEQAKEYGHSELREFSFLVVHSLLHLFGYDHMEENDRKIMEEQQSFIMNQLNIQR